MECGCKGSEPTASHFQEVMNAAPAAHVHQVGEGVGRSRLRKGALLWLPRTVVAEAARVYLGERLDAYLPKVRDCDLIRQEKLHIARPPWCERHTSGRQHRIARELFVTRGVTCRFVVGRARVQEHDRRILDHITALRQDDWNETSDDADEKRPSGHRKFDEVPIELILPFGSGMAFSQDSDGKVIGLKFGRLGDKGGEVAELICQLNSLRRLVLYSSKSLSVPDQLVHLPLELAWFGGAISRIPEGMFRKDLPLTVVKAKEEGVFKQVLSPATYDLVVRARSRKDTSGESASTQTGPSASAEEAALATPGYAQAASEIAHLKGIMISARALADPPIEIVAKGQAALLSYYAETAGESRPLNELKVILVGQGGAGKTSLVKRLMGEKFNKSEKQTHGINIKRHTMTTATGVDIKINYWDFGGQEIMHATHQFFLSKRSVYILVLDGRKDEDPEYWLQHIESFGGDSPIYIVLNKIDEHEGYEVNRRFLLAKYKGIVDFHRVSCARGKGIDQLLTQLRDRLPAVPMLQTKWPRAWFDVKHTLEARQSPFITLDGYRECCAKFGVSLPENQELLVDFLHDLGVILHFRDIQLLDTHVLDPRWVTEGVYRIINSRALAMRNGVLPLDQVGAALKKRKSQLFDYPVEKHAFLIDLMLKFELCYRVDSATILVPDLLDIQEPLIESDNSHSLSFVLEFAYLPRSVMARFIVRMHTDIVDGQRWRTGVVLRDAKFSATALVRADEAAKRIYIEVTGSQKRDFFSVVRKALNDITGSFEKLVVREFVPLPDHREVLVEYQELLGYEKAGKSEYFVGKVGTGYDVKSLLNGFESATARLAEQVIRVEGNYYAGATIVNNVVGVGTSIANEGSQVNYQPAVWEKALVYFCAIAFLCLVGYLLIRNQPFADANLVVALRVILSLFVAVLGAAIPGLLHVDFSARGLAIRAAGALGLFVIAFLATPGVLPLGLPK